MAKKANEKWHRDDPSTHAFPVGTRVQHRRYGAGRVVKNLPPVGTSVGVEFDRPVRRRSHAVTFGYVRISELKACRGESDGT